MFEVGIDCLSSRRWQTSSMQCWVLRLYSSRCFVISPETPTWINTLRLRVAGRRHDGLPCSRRGSSCAPCSARRACPSRSWRRSPSRTAGSRAAGSWSPQSATARAPTGSIWRASPTVRSCWCRIRRTDETDSQWSSFANIMLSNAESSQDKIWPLKFLIHFGNELPGGIQIKLYMSFWLSFYIFSNVRKALFYRLYGHFAFVVNLAYLGLSSYIFAIKRG